MIGRLTPVGGPHSVMGWRLMFEKSPPGAQREPAPALTMLATICDCGASISMCEDA